MRSTIGARRPIDAKELMYSLIATAIAVAISYGMIERKGPRMEIRRNPYGQVFMGIHGDVIFFTVTGIVYAASSLIGTLSRHWTWL